MSEKSWVLQGVDPETQRLAVAEAERLGVSVSDFLTEVLRGTDAPAADEIAPENAPPAEQLFAAPPRTRENFAFRHRLDALERRITLATGGLETAVHSMDGALISVTGRLDQTEALAADTADLIEGALAELSGEVIALRKRLGDAERHGAALAEADHAVRADWEARCAKLEQRLNEIEAFATGAHTETQRLHSAHNALQRALAADFNEFAEQTDARLAASAAEARAVAEDAARHADEALARALNSLRETRESFEDSLAEQAEESAQRMHAAFADAAERLSALAGRVIENERALARANEHLHGRVSDVEDAFQAALEEISQTQSAGDAALAAQIASAREDARGAAEASAHALRQADARLNERLTSALAGQAATLDEINAELGELGERHAGAMARLKLMDAALSDTVADIADLRDGAETRFHQETQVWQARAAALDARIESSEQSIAHLAQAQSAETARVEACVFAALEKLAQDIAAGDAAQAGHSARLAASLEELRGAQDGAAARFDAGAAELREQHAGVLARLRLLEGALGENGGEHAPIAARLGALESAIASTETRDQLTALQLELAAMHNELARTGADGEALSALRAEVAALSAAKPDEALLTDMRERLAATDINASENAERLQGLARMLGRVTAQNADAASQSEDRLHKMELALADVRLAALSASQEAPEAVAELGARLAQMEERQAEAFEGLHASIANFIQQSEARLYALEQGGVATLSGDEVLIAHAIESRLTELEQRDMAGDFAALRQRMEERIAGVESRSVRALEQLGETVGLIEQRFSRAETDAPDAKIA